MNPFFVRFINDKDQILEIPQNVIGLEWKYDRQGGCGNAVIILPSSEATGLTGEHEVHIVERTGVFSANRYGTGKLYGAGHKYGISSGEKVWYVGFVNFIKMIDTEDNIKQILCSGFRDKLRRVIINQTFSSKEISTIVNTIMATVTTETNVGSGTIEATGFTADSLEFDNESADKVIQKLVELAGNYEWGVDRNKELYFVAKKQTIEHRFFKGVNVIFHENEDDFESIINSILVVGGDVAGTPFSETVENSTSIAKFDRRKRVVQNSSITTSSVANQLADSIMATAANPERRGKIAVNPHNRLIETSVPLGKLAVVDGDVLSVYGTGILYGTIKYGDAFGYQIESIAYSLEGKELSCEIDLGNPLSSLTDKIAQIEYTIDQQRQNL